MRGLAPLLTGRLRLSQPFHDLATVAVGGANRVKPKSAETIIEAVAILDCNRLGEAACGDGEVIEEADTA